jgi:hypothetical protein
MFCWIVFSNFKVMGFPFADNLEGLATNWFPLLGAVFLMASKSLWSNWQPGEKTVDCCHNQSFMVHMHLRLLLLVKNNWKPYLEVLFNWLVKRKHSLDISLFGDIQI